MGFTFLSKARGGGYHLCSLTVQMRWLQHGQDNDLFRVTQLSKCTKCHTQWEFEGRLFSKTDPYIHPSAGAPETFGGWISSRHGDNTLR